MDPKGETPPKNPQNPDPAEAGFGQACSKFLYLFFFLNNFNFFFLPRGEEEGREEDLLEDLSEDLFED